VSVKQSIGEGINRWLQVRRWEAFSISIHETKNKTTAYNENYIADENLYGIIANQVKKQTQYYSKNNSS